MDKSHPFFLLIFFFFPKTKILPAQYHPSPNHHAQYHPSPIMQVIALAKVPIVKRADGCPCRHAPSQPNLIPSLF